MVLEGYLELLFAQVIADFDGTLTRYWYDGARGQSTLLLLLPSFLEEIRGFCGTAGSRDL